MNTNDTLAFIAAALDAEDFASADECCRTLRRALRQGCDQPDWTLHPAARTYYDNLSWDV